MKHGESSNEVYFHASSFGNLMTEPKGQVITEKQLNLLKGYEDRYNGIGKPLTKNQEKELKLLVKKRDTPIELSDTAKDEIEKIWLLNTKGFYDELENKYVTKGLLNEQDGLDLVSDILDIFLIKNDKRISENNLTGEADAFFILEDKKIVVDIKCNWDARKFMKSKLNKLYEYQLRIYMYLCDAEEAWLCYCLTDTPRHLVEAEKKKLYYKYFNENMTMEELMELEEMIKPLYEQIERNLIYSNNPAYTKEERVKTYKITRDKEIEAKMLEKIPLALEYYKTIKLNQL